MMTNSSYNKEIVTINSFLDTKFVLTIEKGKV